MPVIDNGQKIEAYRVMPEAAPKEVSRLKKILYTPLVKEKPKVQVPKPEKPVKTQKPKKVKKEKPQKQKTKSKKNLHKKILLGSLKAVVFIFSGFLLTFSGAVYAYRENFNDRALYGTKVLGLDVGGKTKTEVGKIVAAKINGITLYFNADGQEFIAKPEEAGVTFDVEKTVAAAMEKGKKEPFLVNLGKHTSSLVYRISPFAAENIDNGLKENLGLIYEIDDAKLGNFTQNLSNKFNVESKNAGLVMQGSEVKVIPAVYGKKIVADSVKLQIEEAIKKNDSGKISIEVEKVNPKIIEKDTQESIDAAQKILSIPVLYSYQGKSFTPDKATVGSWIIFNTKTVDGVEKLLPEVDPKKVYPYVYGLGKNINIQVINKKVTIKNGAEQVVEQEGKDGLALDADKASFNSAKIMNEGRPVNMELPTYAVKFKTQVNNIVVADWAKYIEVNISTQKMRAYLAGGEVVGEWSITTGANGWSTPTGTFLISRKSGEGGAPGAYGGGVCMPNPPSATPLCGINYVSTFTAQGHAIHEAWWRSSFGGQDYRWNGSHGCVNATYDIAKWIYYWAPIGTPVIVHY